MYLYCFKQITLDYLKYGFVRKTWLGIQALYRTLCKTKSIIEILNSIYEKYFNLLIINDIAAINNFNAP